jgi:hypothetical protein
MRRAILRTPHRRGVVARIAKSGGFKAIRSFLAGRWISRRARSSIVSYARKRAATTVAAAATAAAAATVMKAPAEVPKRLGGGKMVAGLVGMLARRYALRYGPLALTVVGAMGVRRPDLGVPGPGVFRPKDLTPTTHGVPVKQWVANGVVFQRNEDGTITVQRKDGTIKTYRPYKPTVFGKKVDAAKFARLAKKYRKTYQELHRLFGRKSCRRRC